MNAICDGLCRARNAMAPSSKEKGPAFTPAGGGQEKSPATSAGLEKFGRGCLKGSFQMP